MSIVCVCRKSKNNTIQHEKTISISPQKNIQFRVRYERYDCIASLSLEIPIANQAQPISLCSPDKNTNKQYPERWFIGKYACGFALGTLKRLYTKKTHNTFYTASFPPVGPEKREANKRCVRNRVRIHCFTLSDWETERAGRCCFVFYDAATAADIRSECALKIMFQTHQWLVRSISLVWVWRRYESVRYTTES